MRRVFAKFDQEYVYVGYLCYQYYATIPDSYMKNVIPVFQLFLNFPGLFVPSIEFCKNINVV